MNSNLFNSMFALAHRSVLLDDAIIFFAQYLPYLLGIGFIVLVFAEHNSKRRLLFFGEALLAVILARGVLTELIRFFYVHPRPFDTLGIQALIPESGNSFPSGHMTFFFALVGIITYFRRGWGFFYFVSALLMGVARVFAGVHWPLDILGGVIIGLFSAGLIHLLLLSVQDKLDSNPEGGVELVIERPVENKI